MSGLDVSGLDVYGAMPFFEQLFMSLEPRGALRLGTTCRALEAPSKADPLWAIFIQRDYGTECEKPLNYHRYKVLHFCLDLLHGTPAHFKQAALLGCDRLVLRILRQTQEPRMLIDNNRPPEGAISEAIKQGRNHTLDHLLEAGGPFPAVGQNHYSISVDLLGLCLEHGNNTALAKLLDKGLDPNAMPKGIPLICHAIEKDNREALQLLLDASADVNMLGVNKTYAIQAALRHSKAMLIFMIEQGADLSVRNSMGNSLLELAVAYSPESLEVLVNAGADINERGENGFTPLFIAKVPKTVRLLLSLGANPHARTDWGDRPIDYCKQHPETRAILQRAMDSK